MIGICCFRNTENGKVYIGSSIDIEQRRLYHLRLLRKGTHYNVHFQSAFNEYGGTMFEFFIVEEIQDRANLLVREQYWMDYHDSSNKYRGYNICPKADRSEVSEESKLKHSITNRLLGIRPPSHKGVKASDETKLKKSLSLKRVGHRPPSNKGNHHSEATRNKQSQAHTGHKWIHNVELKQTKHTKSELVPQYLSNGWELGMLKTHL